jgi:hypothetical protein
MPTHAELVELAKICAFNARAANEARVALELWRMAREYQEKAAELNSGKLPDIGASPLFGPFKSAPPH